MVKLPRTETDFEKMDGNEVTGMDGVKPFTIMRKDTAVMRVDFDAFKYEVLNEKYLPYPMRGRLQKLPDSRRIKSSYDMTQFMIAVRKNEEAVVSWLAGYCS